MTCNPLTQNEEDPPSAASIDTASGGSLQKTGSLGGLALLLLTGLGALLLVLALLPLLLATLLGRRLGALLETNLLALLLEELVPVERREVVLHLVEQAAHLVRVTQLEGRPEAILALLDARVVLGLHALLDRRGLIDGLVVLALGHGLGGRQLPDRTEDLRGLGVGPDRQRVAEAGLLAGQRLDAGVDLLHELDTLDVAREGLLQGPPDIGPRPHDVFTHDLAGIDQLRALPHLAVRVHLAPQVGQRRVHAHGQVLAVQRLAVLVGRVPALAVVLALPVHGHGVREPDLSAEALDPAEQPEPSLVAHEEPLETTVERGVLEAPLAVPRAADDVLDDQHADHPGLALAVEVLAVEHLLGVVERGVEVPRPLGLEGLQGLLGPEVDDARGLARLRLLVDRPALVPVVEGRAHDHLVVGHERLVHGILGEELALPVHKRTDDLDPGVDHLADLLLEGHRRLGRLLLVLLDLDGGHRLEGGRHGEDLLDRLVLHEVIERLVDGAADGALEAAADETDHETSPDDARSGG